MWPIRKLDNNISILKKETEKNPKEKKSYNSQNPSPMTGYISSSKAQHPLRFPLPPQMVTPNGDQVFKLKPLFFIQVTTDGKILCCSWRHSGVPDQQHIAWCHTIGTVVFSKNCKFSKDPFLVW